MSNNGRLKIISIGIVSIIILSICIGYFYYTKRPQTHPVDHYCNFSVDAGPDIEVSTNESVIFLGKIIFPCDYWGGIEHIEWDFNGDDVVDYSGSGETDHYHNYWGTDIRFYFQYYMKYPDSGVYNATFRARNSARTYVAEDTRVVRVHEAKLNFTISIDNNVTSSNETLDLHYSIANEGERGFNISGLSELDETVRLYLVRDDGVVLKKYIAKYPSTGPPGPYWLGSGSAIKGNISFDLSKDYENETYNIHNYKPSAHPGHYQIYVRYVNMGLPVSWLSSVNSNRISIVIQ